MDQLFKIIIFMWIYFDRTSCFCCCNFCVILVTGLLIFICFSNIDEGNRLETSLSGNSYWYCFISKVLILAKNGYLKVFHSIRYFAHHWFLLTTVAPCRVHLAMFSTYFYYALVVFFHVLFNVDFSPFLSDLFSLRRFVKKQNIAAFKQNCSTNYLKKNTLSEYIYIRKYKYVYVCVCYTWVQNIQTIDY